MFPSRIKPEQPIDPGYVRKRLQVILERAGCKRIRFHDLRHTFATIASCQGASLFDIGKALGHSTPATTGKIYTHLLDQNHTATLDRVANALK